MLVYWTNSSMNNFTLFLVTISQSKKFSSAHFEMKTLKKYSPEYILYIQYDNFNLDSYKKNVNPQGFSSDRYENILLNYFFYEK